MDGFKLSNQKNTPWYCSQPYLSNIWLAATAVKVIDAIDRSQTCDSDSEVTVYTLT
jgi:hypothetical protein